MAGRIDVPFAIRGDVGLTPLPKLLDFGPLSLKAGGKAQSEKGRGPAHHGKAYTSRE
jgi:hypothetical protein